MLGVDKLWKELCDTPSEDRKAKFQAILQSYQEPQVKVKPQPAKRPGKAPVGRSRKCQTPASSSAGSRGQPAPAGGRGSSGPPVKLEDQPGKLANSNPKGRKRPIAELGNPEVDPKGLAPTAAKRYKVEGITIPEGIAKKSLSVSISIKRVGADGSFTIKSPKDMAQTGGDGEKPVKTEPENDLGPSKPDPVHHPEDEPLKEDIPLGGGVPTKVAHKAKPGSSKEEQKEDGDDDEEKDKEDEEEAEDNEDDNKEESPSKKKKAKAFAAKVATAHYRKFEEDTDLANYVKGALLGLGEQVIPTQAQIDASPCSKRSHPISRSHRPTLPGIGCL